jgi:hypothetical protein
MDPKGPCGAHSGIEKSQTELLRMIEQIRSSVNETGTRIDFLEEKLQSTHVQIDRLEVAQSKLGDKFDTLNEQVTGLRTNLPLLLTDVVKQTTANMATVVGDCRKLQDAENKSKFIGIPESLQSNLLKVAALALLSLLGLDTAGVINIKPRADATERQQQTAGSSHSSSSPHITVTTPVTIEKK